MGVFRIKSATPRTQSSGRSFRMPLWTRSTFSWVPKEILLKAGIKPAREKVEPVSITGEKVPRQIGPALCEVEGKRGPCWVIFGEEGDIPVLGSEAMEGIGIEVDPVERKIRFKDILAVVGR